MGEEEEVVVVVGKAQGVASVCELMISSIDPSPPVESGVSFFPFVSRHVCCMVFVECSWNGGYTQGASEE